MTQRSFYCFFLLKFNSTKYAKRATGSRPSGAKPNLQQVSPCFGADETIMPGQFLHTVLRDVATMDAEDMMEERESSQLAWLGILMAIVGNIILAVGFVIQKVAHNTHAKAKRAASGGDTSDEISGENQGSGSSDQNLEGARAMEEGNLASSDEARDDWKPGASKDSRGPGGSVLMKEKVLDDVYFVKSKTWWGGLALIFTGEVLNAVALGFASGSVVPPIGALALVLIALLSFFVLHERLSHLNWAGLVVSVAGVALVGCFAPKGNTSESMLSAAEVGMLTKMPRFYVFALAMAVVLAGLCVSLFLRPGLGEKHVIVFAAVAGLAGMYKVRAIKVLLQMFGDTLSSNRNAFTSGVFWAYAVLCAVTTLMSLYFLNKGQAAFRQSLIIPVYFCIFSTFSVLSANLFYDEFADPDFNIPAYVIGLAFLVIGVLLFSVPASLSTREIIALVTQKRTRTAGASGT